LTSRMLLEARDAPTAVARQLAHDIVAYREFGEFLRAEPPTSLLTVARGSSDHAAHYCAYLIMARMGRLVTSLPMSLVTLYQSKIHCAGLATFAFSQSGASPDLVEPTRYFRQGGAVTSAFVNDAISPLAEIAQWVFPLHAGPETSVAATKSVIAQMTAAARLIAAWQNDIPLQLALSTLPQVLSRAVNADWSAALPALREADRLLVIGRGLGMPVALEAALKFKETCGIQAEAFSGAEVQHGPKALIGEGYPVLVFAPRGPAQEGLLEVADELRSRGARVLVAAPGATPRTSLPIMETAATELDPISMLQSFYPMVEALSRARGLDPDRPRHLNKVTRTY